MGLHITYLSSECYPAAKVGGLADVVGALPKYINSLGHDVSVIMPKYDLPWINNCTTTFLSQGTHYILDTPYDFSVEKVIQPDLGYSLIFINIPNLFYRKGVYADENSNYFADEAERNTSFVTIALKYISSQAQLPDIVHSHDHHTALAPFMMSKCKAFKALRHIPTVLTIHNEKYRGRFSWQKQYLLPEFDPKDGGLLDWDEMIDPLACGVKCCWKMTTVSPSYMQELLEDDGPLKPLFQQEKKKAIGLLNGIDDNYWNPTTDPLIYHQLGRSISDFKLKNKQGLTTELKLAKNGPLFAFIGRLAQEKGADLIPQSIHQLLSKHKNANFILLGTGMASLENELLDLQYEFKGRASINIMYDERLAHKIYAGVDFLLMPSRVEPCGLNQMYALRYGTIPIVRATGGLKDTIKDSRYKNGTGIKFNKAEPKAIVSAMNRAMKLHDDREKFSKVLSNAINCDFSWSASASAYIQLYESLVK